MGRRSRTIQIAGSLAAPAGGGRWDRRACPGSGATTRSLRRALDAHTIESPSPIFTPRRLSLRSRRPGREVEERPARTRAKRGAERRVSKPSGCTGRHERSLPVGRDALLVEVSSPQDAVALAAWARERALARDVVPGAETVLFDGVADPDGLADPLAAWRPAETVPGPRVEIPVTYDGPDLENGRRAWGCDVEDVAARHRGHGVRLGLLRLRAGLRLPVGAGGRRCPGWRPRAPGCPRARSHWPVPGAASTRWPRPAGGRSSATPTPSCGTPGASEPALLAPGTRVRFVGR